MTFISNAYKWRRAIAKAVSPFINAVVWKGEENFNFINLSDSTVAFLNVPAGTTEIQLAFRFANNNATNSPLDIVPYEAGNTPITFIRTVTTRVDMATQSSVGNAGAVSMQPGAATPQGQTLVDCVINMRIYEPNRFSYSGQSANRTTVTAVYIGGAFFANTLARLRFASVSGAAIQAVGTYRYR